jgi:RNA polymerase sigma-70 factor (ECF subfamily)
MASLADALRAHLPDRLLAGDGGSALEALLHRALGSARARWPKVLFSDEAFLQHLALHAPADVAGLQALNLEDLFLAGACVAGDRAALAALEEQVFAQVPRWVTRFEGLDPDEVKQDLRQKLLLGESAHLRDYGGRGALDRWVRVAALRSAIDRQRRIRPQEDKQLEQLLSEPDPELDFVKLRDREALQAILHDALHGLPTRDMNLMRLHYAEGVSLERLAALERVSRSTVARQLNAARAAVLDRVRGLLRERLRLSRKEGESLVRLLRSRLDFSLRRALSRTPSPAA